MHKGRSKGLLYQHISELALSAKIALKKICAKNKLFDRITSEFSQIPEA